MSDQQCAVSQETFAKKNCQKLPRGHVWNAPEIGFRSTTNDGPLFEMTFTSFDSNPQQVTSANGFIPSKFLPVVFQLYTTEILKREQTGESWRILK